MDISKDDKNFYFIVNDVRTYIDQFATDMPNGQFASHRVHGIKTFADFDRYSFFTVRYDEYQIVVKQAFAFLNECSANILVFAHITVDRFPFYKQSPNFIEIITREYEYFKTKNESP